MPGELPFDNLLAVLFGFAFLPLVLLLSGRLGLYTVIREREAQVYTCLARCWAPWRSRGSVFL